MKREVIADAASKVSFGGGAGAAGATWFGYDPLAIIGVFIALAGLSIQWWYRHQMLEEAKKKTDAALPSRSESA